MVSLISMAEVNRMMMKQETAPPKLGWWRNWGWQILEGTTLILTYQRVMLFNNIWDDDPMNWHFSFGRCLTREGPIQKIVNQIWIMFITLIPFVPFTRTHYKWYIYIWYIHICECICIYKWYIYMNDIYIYKYYIYKYIYINDIYIHTNATYIYNYIYTYIYSDIYI